MRRRAKRILNHLCAFPAWLIPEVAEALYQIGAVLKPCLSNSSPLADRLTEAALQGLQCCGARLALLVFCWLGLTLRSVEGILASKFVRHLC